MASSSLIGRRLFLMSSISTIFSAVISDIFEIADKMRVVRTSKIKTFHLSGSRSARIMSSKIPEILLWNLFAYFANFYFFGQFLSASLSEPQKELIFWNECPLIRLNRETLKGIWRKKCKLFAHGKKH